MPSTAIRAFSYDDAAEALEVVFTTGRRYVYAGVPAEVAAGLGEAASRGRYFNAHIRDRYPYAEMTTGRMRARLAEA